MDTATIALILAAIAFGAVLAMLAVIFAPARNAALGAWSLASWTGRRRRREEPGGPPSKR